jgi:hypothetical protein
MSDLKYKNKYLNLQRQIGGVNGIDDVNVSKPSLQTLQDDPRRLILDYPNYSAFNRESIKVQKENREISLKRKLGKTTLDGLFSTGASIDIREPLNNGEIYLLAELFVSDILNTKSLIFHYGIDTPLIKFAPLKDALLNPTDPFYLFTDNDISPEILKRSKLGNNHFFIFAIGNDNLIDFQLRFIFSCIGIMQREGDVILETAIYNFRTVTNYKQIVFTNSINTIIFGLERNIPLKEITIDLSGIGDGGAMLLAKALKTHQKLTKLFITKNNIGAEGANAIAEALKKNTALTILYMYNNDIGDEGATALAEALITNTTLATLSINENNIGAKGTNAIAEALKKNTALTTLYMYGNDIGDEGATALAEALITNTTLATLFIKKNNIGAKGAKAIAEALKKNTALTELYMFDNDIGDEGATALAEALETNTTLLKLYIGQPNDNTFNKDIFNPYSSRVHIVL